MVTLSVYMYSLQCTVSYLLFVHMCHMYARTALYSLYTVHARCFLTTCGVPSNVQHAYHSCHVYVRIAAAVYWMRCACDVRCTHDIVYTWQRYLITVCTLLSVASYIRTMLLVVASVSSCNKKNHCTINQQFRWTGNNFLDIPLYKNEKLDFKNSFGFVLVLVISTFLHQLPRAFK